MTPFLAGALFGALFAGSLFIVFIGRVRAPQRHATQRWEDPFDEPAPPVIARQPINRIREINL